MACAQERRRRARSSGVPGSGRRVAIRSARQAARGRRAGQMCRVEMWPWRTFFSCTASIEVWMRGKAMSIRRLSVSMGTAFLGEWSAVNLGGGEQVSAAVSRAPSPICMAVVARNSSFWKGSWMRRREGLGFAQSYTT
jgi:hypothetical protein